MTRLGDIFALSQQISVAASEECARLHNPEIDVDHLFLALLVSGGTAGRRLRDLGITLDDARSAVAQVHADRVASLGVRMPPAASGALDPAAAERVTWSPRALRLMRSLPTPVDDLPLLRALLDEPGGLTLQVLRTLSVDEAAARTAVSAAPPPTTSSPTTPSPNPAPPGRPRRTRDRVWRSVTHEGFAPAPPAEVWALVTDPARRLEWDSLLVAGVEPVAEGVVELTAATTGPDGRRIRIRPRQLRMRQTLVEEGDHHVEWETTWPDAGNGSVLRLRIRLEPVTGGTRLELRSRWRRRRGLGGLVRTPLLPLMMFGMKQQLLHRAAGISRATR